MLPELERTGPIPLYQQIQNWMRDQIAHGMWPEHYKLMSEIDLAAQFGVNRGTIRNALDALIQEGLLVRIHGRGTFVRSSTIEQPLADHFITFSEGLVLQNIAFETRVIEQKWIVPSQRVASLLSAAPDTEVFYLKRIRYVRGEPLILLENHIVSDVCDGIETIDFESHTLFETLEHRYGLKIDWGRRLFEARGADEAVAEALGIDPCNPVMYIQQLSYLQDGSPVELSDLWICGDHFRISAIIKREDKHTQLKTAQEYR